jgi:hypothetical protein
MKRLFLSVVLLATCVVATSAQIKYDVRASLGLSSMLSPSNADTHVAFKIGADASIPIGKSRFAVEPGLFFSQKGIRFNGYYLVGDIMSDAKYSTTLNYLEMPILATSKGVRRRRQSDTVSQVQPLRCRRSLRHRFPHSSLHHRHRRRIRSIACM